MWRIGLTALLAALVGCEGGAPLVVGCGDDGACPAGACVARRCVPRAVGARTVPLLINPAAGRAEGALQLDAVFRDGKTDLRVTGRRAVFGTITLDAAAESARAQVVVTYPAVRLGLPDLRVEATATGSGGVMSFELDLPEHLLQRRDGLIRVIPTPPLDRLLAPWAAPGPTTDALALAPPRGDELLLVEGQLLERIAGEVLPRYSARAVYGNAVVSNRPLIDPTTGTFFLRVPAGQVPGGVVGALRVELVSDDPLQALPRLIVDQAVPVLNPVRPPPFAQPVVFDLPVLSRNAAGEFEPVPLATLSLRARLDEAEGARAYYEQRAQTDAGGRARVALVPGSGGKTLEYAVAVTPAADSPFASLCVKRSVAARAGGDAPVLAAIELSRKVELKGTVRAEAGPEANVQVVAMRLDEGTRDAACEGDLRARIAAATTDDEGRYALWVEPGLYRLEFAPLEGSAAPVFVEDGVSVTGAELHNVRLPAGAVADGRVVDGDGAPVGKAEITCFPAFTALWRGPAVTARTDSEGRFRVVLPRE